MKKTACSLRLAGIMCVALFGCDMSEPTYTSEPGDDVTGQRTETGDTELDQDLLPPIEADQHFEFSGTAEDESSMASESYAAEKEGEDSPGLEGLCSGWPGPVCRVQCSNGWWYDVGYNPPLGWGDCTPTGRSFCGSWGMSAIGHCWGT